MKTLLRYVLLGLVPVILFLVAAIAVFIVVFDANEYKTELSDLVREQTGRELVFYGDVELTFFPALGMRLGAVSLSNPVEFGAQPMIRVGQASVSVDLVSLLKLAPEIDRLVMRDLEVNLLTDKTGRSNWQDLLAPAAAADEEAPARSAEGGAEAGSDFEIRGAFAGLELENVRLLWLDEQAGERYEIVAPDVSTGRIEPNRPFPLTLHLDASASGDLDIVLDLETEVEYLIERQHLTLGGLALRLNEFTVGGRVALSDFAKPTPTLRFDLESQLLDVDALLGTPPPAAAAGGPQPEAAPAQAEEDTRIELPMQTLRDLDIDGRFAIAQMKVQNLHLQDVDLRLQAQQGQVRLQPLTLDLYGGRSQSAVVIDVRGDIPKYTIEETLSAVRAGDLLRDYLGEESISGRLDAEIELTTRGEWVSVLKKNSNGRVSLAFKDGALNGFNLRHSIDSAKAKLRGREPPPQTAKETDFSSLTLSGTVENGVFRSKDLDLQAPLLRVGGRGSADLNREVVDYLVDAKLVGTTKGQQGGSADELAGLDIPVAITGPFAAPKIDVLLDELLKQRAAEEKARLQAEIDAQKEEIRQQLEAEKKALSESKKLEEAKDRAKQKLEDKLKKLFD